jgi:hypothetical protein
LQGAAEGRSWGELTRPRERFTAPPFARIEIAAGGVVGHVVGLDGQAMTDDAPRAPRRLEIDQIVDFVTPAGSVG